MLCTSNCRQVKAWTAIALAHSCLFVAAPNAFGIPRAGAESDAKFRIVSVNMKVEDVNADLDSAMISWKVVVQSELTSERKAYGKIRYLDSDGYEVDGDMFGGCIAGGEQRTFTGLTNVSTEEVDKIVTVKAELLDDFPCD